LSAVASAKVDVFVANSYPEIRVNPQLKNP